MTTNDPKREGREPGYRGALPPRNDRLAVPWIGIVVAIFFLMFVLSALQIPSRFEPEATPLPSVAASASPSAEPAESAEASGSAEPSESADASGSASAEASAAASAEASAQDQ